MCLLFLSGGIRMLLFSIIFNIRYNVCNRIRINDSPIWGTDAFGIDSFVECRCDLLCCDLLYLVEC